VSVNGTNNIYLSPHHDDAAFSLGAWISTHPGGRLVNLFTRSISVFDKQATAKGVEEVSAVRAAEDVVFARRLGLERFALGLDEPKLSGRHSRDISLVGLDIEQLREPLCAWLDRYADAGSVIFCPAAIGNHVNHLATRMVTWEWAVLRGRETNLRFYEDLPYASRLHLRLQGVERLRASVPGWTLRRHAWRAGLNKLELINLYPTQHGRPARLRRFTPLTFWPLGPHEAVWAVERC